MNDTHPTIAAARGCLELKETARQVAEMMRLLVDVMHVAWDEAWDLTTKCTSEPLSRVAFDFEA